MSIDHRGPFGDLTTLRAFQKELRGQSASVTTQKEMNIYLISRTDKIGWDEHDACVVSGNTEEEAIKASYVSEYLNLKVEFIGTGKFEKAEVILGSFNAG